MSGAAPAERWDGWGADHVIRVMAANGIGLVLVFIGWWATSGEGSFHRQLPWLNVGVAGLVVAGAGNGLWLARGRRAITQSRKSVTRACGSTNGRVVVRRSSRDRLGVGESGMGSMGLVAGQGMSFYHRATCLLVGGKTVRVLSRAEHERDGLLACEVCRP
jgi:hypothetical protein